MKKTANPQPIIKRVQQDMPLVEYAVQVLMENKAPLHVKELTERMITMGWKPVSAKPSHVVYTNLFGIISRKGDQAGIKFLGRGIFSTERNAEGHEVKEVPIATKSVIVDGKKISLAMISNIPTEKRKCHNCHHNTWSGPQEFYQQYGQCDNDVKSERPFNKRSAEACDHWKPKSQFIVLSEQKKRDTLRLAVMMSNLSVTRARRSR